MKKTSFIFSLLLSLFCLASFFIQTKKLFSINMTYTIILLILYTVYVILLIMYVIKYNGLSIKNMDINISHGICEKLLKKAYELFGKYRVLDGFLDMLDTINSYCLINNYRNINAKILKELDYLWEKIY